MAWRTLIRVAIAWIAMCAAVVVAELPGGTTQTLLNKWILFPTISGMIDRGFAPFTATNTSEIIRHTIFVGIAVGTYWLLGFVPWLRRRSESA